MIIRPRLAKASVSGTANLVGASRAILLRVITAYTNLGKVSSVKHNSELMLKLKNRNRRMKKIFAGKQPVSMNTIQWELHASNIQARVDVPKTFASVCNAMKILQLSRDPLNWTQLKWEEIIWSVESSFTLFLTIRRALVWETAAEAFHVDCLISTIKHGGGSVMENVLCSKMTSPMFTPLTVFKYGCRNMMKKWNI
ncbi:UNVERIFIED_CONTAM: tc1a [Trichonephila clavipes]